MTRPPSRRSSKVLLLLIWCVFTAVFFFNYYAADDAFITVRVVDNFAHGYGVRWNVDERVQVFTSPLHFLLIAIPYRVFRALADSWGPGFAYGLLLAISYLLSALAVMLFLAIVTTTSRGRIVAFLLLMSSQAFVTFCGSGLETPLLYLLVFLFFLEFFHLSRPLDRDDLTTSARGATATRLWVLFALCVLTRFDAILVVAPAALVVVMGRCRNRVKTALHEFFVGVSPLLIWFAFSLVYFGFLLPNSYYAKLGVEAPRTVLLRMGLDYLLICLKQDPVTLLLPLACGLLLGKGPARWPVLGAWLYIVYVAAIGGDFIGYRFLAVPFFVCVHSLFEKHEVALSGGNARLVGAVGVLVAYNAFVVGSPARVVRDGPVANDVSYWYPRTALRFAIKPLPNVDFVVRRGLFGERTEGPTETRVLRGPGGLGPFCLGPRVHFIDRLGITDPLMARLPAMIDGAFLPGHLEKEIPKGYMGVAAGEAVGTIERRDIGEYERGLRLITSGGLLAPGRWREIVRYNFGDRIRFTGPYPPAISAHPPLREQYLKHEYPPRYWWR